MYENLLEYVINADKFYQLWLAAEMEESVSFDGRSLERMDPDRRHLRYRSEWNPALLYQFDDERLVPDIIRMRGANHRLDGELRFHAGNTGATIDVDTLELYWGVSKADVVEGFVIVHPSRAEGPARITLSGLRMWHHQNIVHRRRGDAVICRQAVFDWNEQLGQNELGLYREFGPYKVVVEAIGAQYTMGELQGDVKHGEPLVSWAIPSGGRMLTKMAHEVISENNIEVNMLAAGNSIFRDEGEEFIFWEALSE